MTDSYGVILPSSTMHTGVPAILTFDNIHMQEGIIGSRTSHTVNGTIIQPQEFTAAPGDIEEYYYNLMMLHLMICCDFHYKVIGAYWNEILFIVKPKKMKIICIYSWE